MKKITFNAPLNHKAYSYEPMQIEAEKVITLYGKRFEQKEIRTEALGTIYVSFWNPSDSWQIEAEMTDTSDIEEEESLDRSGISM